MKIMLLAVLFLVVVSFNFQAFGSDWKYFGNTTSPKKIVGIAFYDNDSVERTKNRNIKVWVKIIDKPEIERVLLKYSDDIMMNVSIKLKNGYAAPMFNVDNNTTIDAREKIIASEEAANRRETKSGSKILYEIDCNDKMFSFKSINVYKDDGGVITFDDMNERKYIIPESNGENIYKILCDK